MTEFISSGLGALLAGIILGILISFVMNKILPK